MGAPVAAIIIRKEKDLVAHFVSAGAISPDTAMSSSHLQIDDGVAFRILRRRAVIREDGQGQLYLDQPTWEALRHTRRRMAFVMLTIICALAAASVLGVFGTK